MMFGWLDISVLALCLIAVVGVGVWSGRDERTTRDFFLGGKRQHWFVVGLSIIATEVSALTFIGVPADAFRGDWNYLQMYFGSFLGRMLVLALLLPAFYRNDVTTVYEYLGRRFGPRTRLMASMMFFASRIIGSGIRLLVASLAISVVFGWRLELVIVGAASVVVAYTMFGGIKAIIWTDAVQALIFISGGIAAVVCLFFLTPGDAASNLAFAYQENKFHMFTWTADLNNEKSFLVLLVHATFMTMAAMGTDQDLTQRMLTCPDLKRGQRSLLFNAIAGLPIVILFLLVGTMLYAFYEQTAVQLPAEILARDDRIFPHFIASSIPVGYGLKGLLVAGIFAAAMSSLDSALGALSSTAVNDVYRIYIRPNASQRHFVLAARIFVLAFGVVLVTVAIAFAEHDKLLWATFKWVGLIFGSLLGVFLLGVLTKGRGADGFTVVAMLSAVAMLVAIKVYQDYKGQVWIAWPWWIVIGTIWTFALGACTTTRKSRHTDTTDP